MMHQLQAHLHTSLEARYWSGHLDAAGKELWQGGKDCEEKKPYCRCRCEEQDLLLRVNSHINCLLPDHWLHLRPVAHLAMVFWQDACWWTLAALMPHPCPLVRGISNFFAPAEVPATAPTIANRCSLYNGEWRKKEGYACTVL
jgi:hypothetical protein